tara:strand:+ start:1861 stop:2016 length:156 start_codon:yes stop_codon:yes gene_type:complete
MAILQTKKIILNGRSITVNADDPRVLLCDSLKKKEQEQEQKTKLKSKHRGK